MTGTSPATAPGFADEIDTNHRHEPLQLCGEALDDDDLRLRGGIVSDVIRVTIS